MYAGAKSFHFLFSWFSQFTILFTINTRGMIHKPSISACSPLNACQLTKWLCVRHNVQPSFAAKLVPSLHPPSPPPLDCHTSLFIVVTLVFGYSPLPAPSFFRLPIRPAIRFYLPIPSYHLARLSTVEIYRSEDIGIGFHHNWQQCANYILQFDYQRRVGTIYPIFRAITISVPRNA